jgi:hypothetical protein
VTPDDTPQIIEAAPESDEPGWRVIDADGNVVESGPGVVLEMVAHTGEEQ